MAEYKQLSDGRPDGVQLGQSATDKVGFYGKAPIAQRSGASQGTFTISTTQSTGWGFLSSTAADAAIALLTEIRATLVAAGLMKGSA
jgi:hypothetical protein